MNEHLVTTGFVYNVSIHTITNQETVLINDGEIAIKIMNKRIHFYVGALCA